MHRHSLVRREHARRCARDKTSLKHRRQRLRRPGRNIAEAVCRDRLRRVHTFAFRQGAKGARQHHQRFRAGHALAFAEITILVAADDVPLRHARVVVVRCSEQHLHHFAARRRPVFLPGHRAIGARLNACFRLLWQSLVRRQRACVLQLSKLRLFGLHRRQRRRTKQQRHSQQRRQAAPEPLFHCHTVPPFSSF